MIKKIYKIFYLTTYALYSRWLNFEEAWKMLYEVRWGDRGAQICSICYLESKVEVKAEPTDDWQQMYWERHLQKYLRLTDWTF